MTPGDHWHRRPHEPQADRRALDRRDQPRRAERAGDRGVVRSPEYTSWRTLVPESDLVIEPYGVHEAGDRLLVHGTCSAVAVVRSYTARRKRRAGHRAAGAGVALRVRRGRVTARRVPAARVVHPPVVAASLDSRPGCRAVGRSHLAGRRISLLRRAGALPVHRRRGRADVPHAPRRHDPFADDAMPPHGVRRLRDRRDACVLTDRRRGR